MKVYSNSNFYQVPTSEGNIAVWDSEGQDSQTDKKPVVFLHGNSASNDFFSLQFESELTKKYRFYAVGLSGHGKSDPAQHPQNIYNIEGYALVALEVMQKLQLIKPAVVGWSLGGHIGINFLQKAQKLAGLLITGTPPIKIGLEGFQQGFQFNAEIASLMSKVEFSEEEAAQFMQAGGFDVEKEPFITQAALKTDGRARECLMNSNMQGVGGDQKELVETDETPLCVVQGENDTNLKIDYIKRIKYKNLFKGEVQIIRDAGHAAFRTHPKAFNRILEEFLAYVYGDSN